MRVGTPRKSAEHAASLRHLQGASISTMKASNELMDQYHESLLLINGSVLLIRHLQGASTGEDQESPPPLLFLTPTDWPKLRPLGYERHTSRASWSLVDASTL